MLMVLKEKLRRVPRIWYLMTAFAVLYISDKVTHEVPAIFSLERSLLSLEAGQLDQPLIIAVN